MCRNSADQSRRFSIVEVEQSAEPCAPGNASGAGHGWRSLEQLISKTLMVPLAVIVLHELVDQDSQVPFPQRARTDLSEIPIAETSLHSWRTSTSASSTTSTPFPGKSVEVGMRSTSSRTSKITSTSADVPGRS